MKFLQSNDVQNVSLVKSYDKETVPKLVGAALVAALTTRSHVALHNVPSLYLI